MTLPFLLMTLHAAPVAAPPTTILFVGNSFTFAANSPVQHFHPEMVHDLNHEKIGGVPALFKALTAELGLNFEVSLETSPGKNLDFHFNQKREALDQPWDVVVLQGYSLLDEKHPGDATSLATYTAKLGELFHHQRATSQLYLMATWARPDRLHASAGPWHGQTIDAMTRDLRRGYDQAKAASPYARAVIPVGEAFALAVSKGVADPDPYDGLTPGQVDLWSFDHYHASTYGYFLEALVVLGRVTGKDPRALGADDRCAAELGLTPAQATALEAVAHDILEAH